MTHEEIHARLKGRFGEAIQEWRPPEAGDAFVAVAADSLHEVCRFLRDEPDLRFDFLRAVSAVERGDQFVSVYHLYSYAHGDGVVLHVYLGNDAPRVSSVADLWRAAEWHEREAFDMMGIVYEGHPDPRRILLPDDWEGHPLRKDYVAPKEYHGVTNE
jgi:NADH-quinone oxidoreductase subunit C